MIFKNSKSKYGIISIFFHWITLLILLFQIPIGFYLVDLEFSDFKISVENYHSILGIFLFYITLSRLIWKTINLSPDENSPIKNWQLIISKINHWLLYITLFTITISGILKKLLSGETVNFIITSISLDYFDFELVELSEKIHGNAAIFLLMLIVIHVLAVIYHHLFLKDPILKKIL